MKASILRATVMLSTFANLIRWRNILMVAGIQSIVFFTLLAWQRSVMSLPFFFLLVFVTLCITAAGNVINDYFDRDLDNINRPGKTIVGVVWPAPVVLRIYVVILVIGAIGALWFALHQDLLLHFPVYVVAVAGLYVYSANLKCRPVIGNVLVALYCAAVVSVVAIPDLIHDNVAIISPAIWLYILFAAITTWYREITKDLEDLEGDRQAGCNTMVVKYGLRIGKIFAIVTGLAAIVSIMIWDTKQQEADIKLGLLVLQGGLVGSMALIWWAKDSTYFSKASTLIKLVMIGGALLLLLKP